jgi:hypothetical protein
MTTVELLESQAALMEHLGRLRAKGEPIVLAGGDCTNTVRVLRARAARIQRLREHGIETAPSADVVKRFAELAVKATVAAIDEPGEEP